MLRGYVLRYLARVASGGDRLSAAAALPAVVRGLVVARAKKVVATCGLETEHGGNEAHVHRLAYLVVRGKEPPNANDIATVETWFATHRDPRGEARAALSLGVGATAALVLAGAGVGGWTYLRSLPRTELGPPPVAASDPVTLEAEAAPEPALQPFFRDALPNWVVALDRESAGRPSAPSDDVASHHAALVAALVDESPALSPSLAGFLDAAESYSHGDAGPEGASAITNSLVLFDDALAEASEPFYVDAVLTESIVGDRRRVLASTYAVSERRRFVSGDRHVTSLELTRLDTLSFEQSLLGYTRPEVRYALVLTERVEDFLITQALPSMHAVEESVIVRGYEDETHTEWVTPLETAFHEDLRTEGMQVISERALIDLAAAIVRRKLAIAAMSSELRGDGVELGAPSRYAYDTTRLDGYASRVLPATVREVRQSQQALASPVLRAAYDQLEEAYLASIARHEAQHRLDYEDDRIVAVPDALAEHTGRTESEDRVNNLAERSNAELSAYLSQVAREPARARTHLVFIAAFVMNRREWGRPESYAALVIFETLATQLGIAHQPFVVGSRIVRGEVARVYMAARARSGDELSRAARDGWRALYGTDLAPLEPDGS